MGVSAIIKLKEGTRIRDVATVMSILLGGKPVKEQFISSSGWHTKVEGVHVKYESSTMPECANINWEGAKLNRKSSGNGGYALYHFEPSGGGRLMLPPSSPLWLAIGRRLVSFFGGSLTYNDCAAKPKVYRAKGTYRPQETNEGFYANQESMLAMKPITAQEANDQAKFAAYPEDKVTEVA